MTFFSKILCPLFVITFCSFPLLGHAEEPKNTAEQAPSVEQKKEAQDSIFPIRVGKNFGFINAAGTVVIEPKYSSFGGFSEDIGIITELKDGKHLAGYIDRTGHVLVKPEFDGARDFKNGVGTVIRDEKYWLVDKEGHLYETPGRIINDASCGLVRIQKQTEINGKKKTLYGYVDTKGKVVIEPQFMPGGNFPVDGLALVGKDREWWYIDTTGKPIIKIPLDLSQDATTFHEGLLRFKDENQGWWGYKNAKGEWAIPAKYDEASDFENGLARVKLESKRFQINPKGEEVPENPIHRTGPYSEGLAVARTDTRSGYINESGQFVFRPRDFERIEDFSCGRGLVRMSGRYGFVDKEGNFAIKCEYDGASSFEHGLAFVMKGGTWQYIDTEGKVVWQGEPPKKIELKPLKFNFPKTANETGESSTTSSKDASHQGEE